MTSLRLESAAPQSRVNHSTTEPLRSHPFGKGIRYTYWTIVHAGSENGFLSGAELVFNP